MGNCSSEIQPSSIDTSHISQFDIKSEVRINEGQFTSPSRQLTLISSTPLISQNADPPESHVLVFLEGQQQVRVETPKYAYLSNQLREMVEGIEIDWVMIDRYEGSCILYNISQHQQRQSMLIRPFPAFESQAFLDIMYELSVYYRLQQLHCKHLHRLSRSYTVTPTNKFINHHTQIFHLEHVDVSLSTIIHDRRQHDVQWTFYQFYQLMVDCVEGLMALHSAGMAHHDILPCNVYFQKGKNAYVIGCFKSVYSGIHQRVSQQVYYRDEGKHSRVRDWSAAVLESRAVSDADRELVQAQKADVYALGMTLLSAFYLCQPIDRKKIAPHNRELSEKYPFLGIIRNMISGFTKRHTIFQIYSSLLPFQSIIPQKQSDYDPTSIKRKPYDPYKFERLMAEGYKVLGCLEGWTDSLKHRSLQKMIASQDFRTAEYFYEMAVVATIQDNKEKSEHYYGRSAEIYRNLGMAQAEERFYEQAIGYIQRGLDCFEEFEGKEHHLVYLKLLVSLLEVQVVSGWALVEREEVARAEVLIMSYCEWEPFAFWEYMQQVVHIHQYHENFQQVNILLEQCLQVQKHIKSKVSPVTIQKKIIINNLRIIQQKGRSLESRTHLIEFTERGIEVIFNDYEYYFIQNPVSKLEMHLLEARLMIHNGKIDQAVAKLQNLVDQTTDWTTNMQEHRMAMQGNRFKTLRAEIIHYLGDAYVSNGELERSLEMYSLSFQLFKQYYGDFYTQEAGKLLDKLTDVYQRLGNHEAFKDCKDIQTKVFKTIYGPYHKYAVRLRRSRRLSSIERTVEQFASFATTAPFHSSGIMYF